MKRRTIAKLVAVSAGLLCLAWGLRAVDFLEAGRAVRRVGPALLLVFVPYGLSIVVDGWGYSQLLRRLGRRIHPLELARVRLSAEALAISLPGGALLADTVNPLILRSRCAIPLDEAAGG